MQMATMKGIIGESSQFRFYSMAEAHHEGEKQPAPEKQADRVERKSEHKAGTEASHGMGDLNKTIVAEVLKKRHERKSGGTDQLNKDDHKGKRVASADDLLPLDKPHKAPLQHQIHEASGHQKTEVPQHKPEAEPSKTEPSNFQRATEAATKALQSVIIAGGGALNETHKFLKGMGDGEVDFVKETGQSLAVARDYYGQALTGKVNVGADVKEFGSAIGQTIGTAGDYYLNQIPKGQANLGNDIGQAGKAAADHWSSLDSEQKGHFVGKEIVPLAVPGAVGIVAKEVQSANLVGKAGEAITALTSAEKVAEMEQTINQLHGHVQKFSEVFGKPLKPAYATVGEGPGRQTIESKGQGLDKGDNFVAMSKADGLGGETGGISNTGMDSAGRRLSFSQDSGIELATAKPGQDGLWKEVPMVRGNEVHVGLGENLPSGTKTIDRVVIKDGIAESIKSIDPRLDSYREPSDFRNKLNEHVRKMQDYEGQPKPRQCFQMNKSLIDEKILHFGIPDGALTPQQVKVFEEIGRDVIKYNESLPVDKPPLKIKVTVLK